MIKQVVAFFLVLTFSMPSFSQELAANSDFVIYNSKYTGRDDNKHNDGHRKSLLVIPASSKPDALTLVVWFHGLNGFSKKTFKRVLSQLEEASLNGHSVAVLIPEMPWSTNTQTPRTRQGRVWKKPNEFKNYLDEAIKIVEAKLEKRNPGFPASIDVVVVGHSAGGSAIMSASIEGSICRPDIKHIVWSDASYGSWLRRANKGCLKTHSALQTVVVRKWDKPHTSAKKFFSTALDRPELKLITVDRKKYTHGQIGNKIFKIANLFPPGC